MGIVLSGGTIVTAYNTYKADLRIVDEVIQTIGHNISIPGDEVIDVSNCILLPGGIDCHTHFDLDVGSTVTADNFETGTKAALIGGTTTIINYATQYRGETLKEALNNELEKANNCFCDYGIHMGITDWNEAVSTEMNEMIDFGVPSFKLYMAYKNNLQVDDGVIYQVLQKSKEIGGLVTFHCENGDVIDTLIKQAIKNKQTTPIYHALTRPAKVEQEAVSRVLKIASLIDYPIYIVHLSTKSGLDEIIEAKKSGQKVYVETCPQYLLLDDSLYETDGEKYVMSPPLRKKCDNKALWDGLSNGEIETIATDHCSFNLKGQKELGKDDFRRIPNGGPGVEERMGLIYTYGVRENKLSVNQMVAQTSTNAAKIFGLFPKKGTIDVGSDADIIVVDPNYETTITASKQTQNVDYTPYEGFKRYGKVRYTFLRGEKVVENEKIISIPKGKYIQRKPFKGGM